MAVSYKKLWKLLTDKDILEYPNYRKYIPKVTEQMIVAVIEKVNMRVKSQVIIDLVMNRYKLIVRLRKEKENY